MRALLPLLFAVLPAAAQSPVIQGLRVTALGDGARLDWFIPQGLSCIDMQVQRLDPGAEAFARRHTVFGLCGSDETDSPYDWTDPGPLLPNRGYAWRVWASNGTVVSDTVFLEAPGGDPARLDLGPNPMAGAGTAWWPNPRAEAVAPVWYDANGRPVRRGASAVARRFAVDAAGLASGTYRLALETPEGRVRAAAAVVVP